MSKTYNNYNDVQAYEALEEVRTATMLDPEYQQWVVELNILLQKLNIHKIFQARGINP